MKAQFAFLHTSPVHVEGFDALVQELAPGLKVHHHVDESLLIAAQQFGATDAAVIQKVEAAMHAASTNCATGYVSMVVCTCSSIGGIAERMNGRSGLQAARIDRAMADRAVALGPRILLVAALESTLDPTTELLMESARAAGKTIEISTLLSEQAWGYFLQGDRQAYLQAISDAVRLALQDKTADIDVVVLAQASMAAAAEELSDLGAEVLTSPRLGVARAISALTHA
ncbi:Asp/Glu/hydantoin racemase [Undibacterium sp. TC4M20W]|uniref:Asp/Glu/hydantoin racemase n=1 Tax=Undibacterium sp. TC4M20W TaxID=3413052 RepID=UPI003BEFA1BB